MSATVGPLLNGVLPPTTQTVNEAVEYEKILKLRDEVFAGSHPRLSVPAHALRVVSPQSTQVASQFHLKVPAPLPASASPSQFLGQPGRREEDHASSQARTNGAPSVSNAQPASTRVSEFDPVLLTISDDVLRAEMQLKRQRLEKALRDQFEQKRLDARKRPAPAEAKPDFDIPSILSKALVVAKPLSPKDDASASDSFDENSFYSSRAPDSTPERGAPSPSPSQLQAPEDEDVFDADEPSGLRVQSAVMGSPLNREREDDGVPPAPRPPHIPVAATTNLKSSNTVDFAAAATDVDDEEEEGEYSPPEAMEHYPTPHESAPVMVPDSRDPRGRPLRRYSELDDGGKTAFSPSDANLRIVRNHITSPIAPQPSRVSPLAVTKEPPLLQNSRRGRQQRVAGPGSPRQSPEAPLPLPPRKKRKLDKRNERKTRRNGGLSPDTFIKEENVSPPPFHDVQPLGSGRQRPNAADRPIIIDDEPGQEVQYVPAPGRYMDSPSRPLPRHVEQLMPLSEPRALSRTSIRPMRDDSDLRRVASMHNLRAEQPREYVEPLYETPVRARPPPSYARVGSPALVEQPRLPMQGLRDEYDRLPPPQEIRVVRTPGPTYREVYREPEAELRYAQPMPPPPVERIVVDQYGRRFREIIQPERASVAPRAMSVRQSDMEESNYDHYRHNRSGSVFVEATAPRMYAQDMPPPPATYRRVAEPPPHTPARSASVMREVYDPTTLPRSASVQVVDRLPPRQAAHMEDRVEYREPVRMSTTLRSGTRYEDMPPGETIARVPSVRPVGREGSIFIDERAPPRREYIPLEQTRYRAMDPEERYFDAQGREIIPLDGPMDGPQRIVERY